MSRHYNWLLLNRVNPALLVALEVQGQKVNKGPQEVQGYLGALAQRVILASQDSKVQYC